MAGQQTQYFAHPQVAATSALTDRVIEEVNNLQESSAALRIASEARARWFSRLIWIGVMVAVVAGYQSVQMLLGASARAEALQSASVQAMIVNPHDIWHLSSEAVMPSPIEELKSLKAIPIICKGHLPKGTQAVIRMWARNGRPYSLGTYRVSSYDLQHGTVFVAPLFFPDKDLLGELTVGYSVEYRSWGKGGSGEDRKEDPDQILIQDGKLL